MARTNTLGNFLTDIADAIRTKKGTSEAIQASDFDTEIENLPSGGAKVKPMSISFRYSIAETIDVSSLDTSDLVEASYMFGNCANLISLDLSNFNTANITNITNMFNGCSSLAFLDVRTFDFANISSKANAFRSVPYDCEIIVANAIQKSWFDGEFSGRYYNVKTVEEYEAE